MKKISCILISTFALCTALFGAEYKDNNNLTHSIDSSAVYYRGPTGYVDINAQGTLSKRLLEPNKTSENQRKKIYGDIETIGSTILMPTKGYGFQPTRQYGNDTVIQPFEFIKEDLNYKHNSSRATFNFRQESGNAFLDEYAEKNIDGKKVVFARLYWGGGISLGWNTPDAEEMRKKYFKNIHQFNEITFGTPKEVNGKTYHRLTAEEKDTRWYGSFSTYGMQFTYQASVDVTDLVKKSLGKTNTERTFSAGDIKASNWKPTNFYGYRDNGWVGGLYAPHYGGWALVIVYDFEDKGASDGLKPKGVYVYDGLTVLAPIHLRGKQSRIDTLEVPLSGFFTPASGKVNSSLTILSFGAKAEVDKENIEILDSKNVYRSVSSNNFNRLENQFNSTITRFDKPMVAHKLYNNQMDLDIYNLKDHISNKQTSTTIKLTAQAITRPGGGVMGERENIGLVAFATELYEPEVCYIEKLQVRGKNQTDEKDFKDVSTDSGSKTLAKTGDTLRLQLKIINRGSEDAFKVGLTSTLNQKNVSYIAETTYMNPSSTKSNGFDVSKTSKISDNSNLQRVDEQNGIIEFSIGEGATGIGNGGTLHKTNEALIQFDTRLAEEFDPDDYIKHNVEFINEDIGVRYSGIINRCEDKKYHLEVAGISNRIVNKKFSELGNSENLFTQLAGREFDTKLLNIMTSSSTGRVLENFDILPTEKIKVDIVPNGDCEKGQNVINEIVGATDTKKNFFLFSKDQLDNQNMLDLKGIKINEAYQKLYFRISYLDASDKLIRTPSCASDPFSIRPKEFRFYNSDNRTNNFGNLVGGKGYTNIWLEAVNNGNALSKTYSTVVNPINFGLSPLRPTTCPVANFAFQNQTTLEAKFENGRGQLTRVWDGISEIFAPEHGTNFVYPNIGHVLITARDKKWTNVDQASGATDPNLNDCIIDNDTITENAAGKIGCDISARNDLNLLFVPNDISINNLRILNFNNGAMTYLSGDATGMEATANFNITARLGDNANTTATLYTRGCYSRNVTFTTGIQGDVSDFTNLQGRSINAAADRAAAALQNILYFNQQIQDPDNNQNIINSKANINTNNNGAYFADRRFFLNGTAPYTVRFNFARDIRFARNPFRITSNNFTFNNISDTDSVAGAPYAAPLNVTNVDFYYGRVYAPDYVGPRTGFNAQIYYSVFCNGCDTTQYAIANSATPPQINNWFVNQSHTNIQGIVTAYTSANFNDGTTIITPESIIANGIEQVWLASTFAPKQDVIQMTAPAWLLYNQANPSATTNDFNVQFFNPTSGLSWGGQSLDKGGKDVGVGDVVGGEKFNKEGSTPISERTNKRLDW
ncbi:hypothetical protein [Campylobacter sp. RM15925]|uniref:hypothetical protein n=1 Tax=Campylobacter sp. RM15925 TaxID=1705724 RepID=UPI001476212E|nr:hypothetical protein [Campylobacter sp. RM15925]